MIDLGSGPRKPRLQYKAEYKTSLKRRLMAEARRDRLRDLKLCINGELHGPATHG